MLAVILCLWILYNFFSGAYNGGESHSDEMGTQYKLMFSTWGFLFFIGVAVQHIHIVSLYLFEILVIPVLLPAFFSKLATYPGWVKISYFLGGRSFLYFKRNVKAGGLLRGLQATYHIKDDAKKRDALQWLKNAAMKNDQTIYSGEMVLIVVIDTLLTHPDNGDVMAAKLKCLRKISEQSIPHVVSELASKYALVPALSSQDWDEIRRVSNQWDTIARNRLTKYLIELHGYYIEQSNLYSWSSLYYWRLNIIAYSLLFRLPHSVKKTPISEAVIKAPSIPFLCVSDTTNKDKEAIDTMRSVMINKTEEARWTARAQELGVWNSDDAWGDIIGSVDRCLTSTSANLTKTDNGLIEKIEQNYKSLRFIFQSIDRKINNNELGSGAENFVMWFKIVELMKQIEKDDDVAFKSAFSMNYGILWSWIAALYNGKNHQRCLVGYMAAVALPIAEECGQNDFCKVLRQVY